MKYEGIRGFHLCLLLTVFLAGCNNIFEVDEKQSRTRDSLQYAGTGKGKVYLANPSILAGKPVKTAKFGDSLAVRFITAEDFLSTPCTFTQHTEFFVYENTTSSDCFNILNDKSASTEPLSSNSGTWTFSTGSDEFYQVNTYYHTKLIMDRFFESLSFTHKQVHLDGSLGLPPATKYNFVDTQSFWLNEAGQLDNVEVYSKCFLEPMNAFFSPADNQLCYGWNNDDQDFFIVQDPTVIYHEMGHLFVKTMMNQRNITSGINPSGFSPYFDAFTYESNLGDTGYDEGGAINEGIADWFAYYMVNRTEVGEFALYKLQDLARPVSEDSSAHTTALSTTPEGRLAYPQYLQYNPPSLGDNVEDVHNSGAIVTHYLVALTEELKNSCSFDTTDEDEIHQKAADYVFLLLNESLAEIGDLTAKGSDFFSPYATIDSDYNQVFFTNLNDEQSYLWTQKVNPPNFRRFFRIMGKNILYHLSSDLCPQFSLDESEVLLDDYGLLLFKSYEDSGNGVDYTAGAFRSYFNYAGDHQLFSKNINPVILNTEVNEDNRRNSILVTKELIDLDSEAVAFVFDGQEEISSVLSFLTFQGENVATSEGLAGTEYNNNNVKISPGEVVGVSLNLFNNSNSTMAGVQILANDWDHMRLQDSSETYVDRIENIAGLSSGTISGGIAEHDVCSINGFPSTSEGGVGADESTTASAGDCGYVSRDNAGLDYTDVNNPQFNQDAPQPICVVQFNDTNETKWVSQNFFRKNEMGLEDKDCLNNSSISGNAFNPNACLVRILPGAEHANFSKIDPQKTWAQTLQGESNSNVQFSSANIVVMEVNKWVVPGTKFNCRFRVRFTNCSDCYQDTNSDYPDYEYAGATPYKLINFQFTVLD